MPPADQNTLLHKTVLGGPELHHHSRTQEEALQILLTVAKELPISELAAFLGRLEPIRVTAMARLSAPPLPGQTQQDELLDVRKAAARLGMSEDYLYRNHRRFPFTVRIGRRVLFSAAGIARYIRSGTRFVP